MCCFEHELNALTWQLSEIKEAEDGLEATVEMRRLVIEVANATKFVENIPAMAAESACKWPCT